MFSSPYIVDPNENQSFLDQLFLLTFDVGIIHKMTVLICTVIFILIRIAHFLGPVYKFKLASPSLEVVCKKGKNGMINSMELIGCVLKGNFLHFSNLKEKEY